MPSLHVSQGRRRRASSSISGQVFAKRAAVHFAQKRNRMQRKKRFKATAILQASHKILRDVARKTIEKHRKKNVENQFNADRTINVLRTALERFFTDNWEQLVVPVYATDTSANNETKEQPVGYSVKSDRVREVNAVVAEYDNDTDGRAIHSRGMFGETVLHQVVLAFVAPELAHGL